MAGIAPREERTRAGVALMVLAVALFICVDTSAKWLFLTGIAPIQAAFLRYAGHFFFGTLIFLPKEGLSVFKTDRPVLQICRSLALLSGTVCNFIALSYLPITLTTTIQFAIPIVITIMAIPILNEKVGLRRFLAVCAGFVGVMIVTQPWGAQWHPAMLFSFASVTSASIYFILTRLLAGVASNATMQMWSSGLPTLVLIPFVLPHWVWPETPLAWLVFFAIGFFGLVSHFCATLAHRFAEAALLAPLFYTQIFFATIAGILVFGTWPTIHTLLGGAVIVASGLYIWLRERQIDQA